ncbi:MAG TPA: bifunctional nuclease family protein [Saprospiraceae bacterium]|nr:bifunctional nuclease family protein [Saprospiraceae bacterium]HMP23977.1 bifunctional nuclease family protein [Saprospiraceae bacterium]
MNVKKELAVVALSDSESQPGQYALILEDVETQRRIPIIIGAFEAQAIAIAMERIQPLRPLTYDLMQNMIQSLHVKVNEVLIHALVDGIFHAHIILEQANKDLLILDARTSDAIALAVRCQAPIYTYAHIIEEAGILSDVFLAQYKKGSLAEYTLPELEELLAKVLAKEDYESAVRIRDLIDRRRQNS